MIVILVVLLKVLVRHHVTYVLLVLPRVRQVRPPVSIVDLALLLLDMAMLIVPRVYKGRMHLLPLNHACTVLLVPSPLLMVL